MDIRLPLALALPALLAISPARAGDLPSLTVSWPKDGTEVILGDDPERAIGVVVKSSFALKPAGQCGTDLQCGHLHLKIDPQGDSCNIPGRPYNSMNSDLGGEVIKARFGHCGTATGPHVIGILLADDQHRPVLVDGKPVTALVRVVTR
ncbi:hypothetical protein [Arenibaculum pallidiluteum]|uniref:hypothetical protein n=1 Tax=Arenibaculum pallidiluteum TaxID=2812559 RepID=UPI001A9740AD|nr:hypothetical protein [Arenibaculum pallidiluteum]